MPVHLVYILLGSNIGKKRFYINQAIQAISIKVGRVKLQSSLYRTAAWGYTNQPCFYNQVILVETSLSPAKTLQQLLAIERQLGRVRAEKMGPRTIDLDILYYDNKQVNTVTLIIPHPHIQNRRFVLKPLVEIAADYVHVVLQQTNKQLLKICTDTLTVKKIK
jgi:2-amino-4-hydroxy-6-hydroxymethyldihydropteridine diphosphokinase